MPAPSDANHKAVILRPRSGRAALLALWLAAASVASQPLPSAAPANGPANPAAMQELEALARAWPTSPGQSTEDRRDVLRIFVSLSMPESSLKRLIAQAERSGAVLVLRGLHRGSMRQTMSALQALIGEHRVNWVIDPPAFERHAIALVPAFVLAPAASSQTACAGACSAEPGALQVSGDVSLDYALEAMAVRRPQERERIEPWLARLRPR